MMVRARRESVAELTFEAFKRFEHFNQLDGAKDIRIFCRILNHHLKIFANVDTKHIVHARERLFSSQIAEVVHEPLKRNV
jgi:hypothetical protein